MQKGGIHDGDPCWQNIRDVIADEIIPRTDEHIEKLLTATKTIPCGE
jgi:hypothetical protein